MEMIDLCRSIKKDIKKGEDELGWKDYLHENLYIIK